MAAELVLSTYLITFSFWLGVVGRQSGYEVHAGFKVILQPKLALNPYFFCFRIQSEWVTGMCHPPSFPTLFLNNPMRWDTWSYLSLVSAPPHTFFSERVFTVTMLPYVADNMT